MKYLILLLILTSCTVTPRYRGYYKPSPSHTEKLDKCIQRLIGTYGVKPTEASDICIKVYRRE